MNSEPTTTDPEILLRRTQAGSREAVMEAANLSDAERRLLLIVNGHTPLRNLLTRLPGADATLVVHRLLEHGLITGTTEATPEPSTFPFEA